MSVVKNELINAGKLFKLRLRDARLGIYSVLFFMGLLVAINVAVILDGFAMNSMLLNSQYFFDYSALVLAASPLVIALVFWQEATGSKSVYPQTSTSRFLSVQMLSFFLVLFALAVALVLYVLVFAASHLISLWQPGFVIGSSFSVAFLAAGFLAALTYLVMVTTVISFVALVVKAFRLYAVIPITGITLFYLYYRGSVYQITALNRLWHVLNKFAQLFLEPKTLGSFLLVCLAITFLFLVAGIVLKGLASGERGTIKDAWMLTVVFIPCTLLLLSVSTTLYLDPSTTTHRRETMYLEHSEKKVLFVPIWSFMERIQENTLSGGGN